MSKKILVNATHPEENRVAIVEDGILTELDIEVAGREPTKGNIYKAVVVRIEAGLQAAFVDYGAERLGFLQIDEINFASVKPDYRSTDEGRRPRINDLLQRGQELLVQITKEERGTKGAALTTYLSLAGRYMVLMPGSQTRGVSRKAESDSQRKELKKAMSSLDLEEGVGYIVRTAALDQSREELERDYRYLIRLYESIKLLEQKAKAPALIYKESNLMIRSIRDYFTTDMDEVLIDDPQVFKEAREFFQLVMPDHASLVKQHQERRPIFSRYQIEDQIETLSRNKVSLPSGGSIVIDPTEALVSIDVNSGKMASEQGVEATATKTNLEAAAEIGRQLRLRDLGGLIVIDFIDMRERKHMRQVESQLKKSLENDKARVSVGRISQFGLLEMSRQRIKAALTEGSYLPCPHCNGTGQQKSPETQAVALLRKIHASAAKGQVSKIDAQLPIEVAAYLLNNKREELVDMERRYQLQVHLHGNRDFLADRVEIEIQKKEKEKSVQLEFVAAGPLLPAPVEAAVPAAKTATEAAAGSARPEAKAVPAGGKSPDDGKQQEKPAAPLGEETSTEEVQQETAEAGTEATKKRRRRRRRKPAVAEPAAELPASDEAAVDASQTSTEDVKTETPGAAVELAGEPQDAPTPAKRPQRRGRSHGKTKAAASAPAAVTADAPASSQEPMVEGPGPVEPQVTAQGGDQTVQKEKPKRHRSRRKPKVANAAIQPETASQAPQQQQVEATPMPAGPEHTELKPAIAETPATKPATKQRRPRRPVKKPEPATASPAKEAVNPVQDNSRAGQEATEKPATAKPVRKTPVRRNIKKPLAKQAVSTGENIGSPAGDSQPVASKAEDQAKPKRRRTVRKKPDKEEASTNN